MFPTSKKRPTCSARGTSQDKLRVLANRSENRRKSCWRNERKRITNIENCIVINQHCIYSLLLSWKRGRHLCAPYFTWEKARTIVRLPICTMPSKFSIPNNRNFKLKLSHWKMLWFLQPHKVYQPYQIFVDECN